MTRRPMTNGEHARAGQQLYTLMESPSSSSATIDTPAGEAAITTCKKVMHQFDFCDSVTPCSSLHKLGAPGSEVVRSPFPSSTSGCKRIRDGQTTGNSQVACDDHDCQLSQGELTDNVVMKYKNLPGKYLNPCSTGQEFIIFANNVSRCHNVEEVAQQVLLRAQDLDEDDVDIGVIAICDIPQLHERFVTLDLISTTDLHSVASYLHISEDASKAWARMVHKIHQKRLNAKWAVAGAHATEFGKYFNTKCRPEVCSESCSSCPHQCGCSAVCGYICHECRQ